MSCVSCVHEERDPAKAPAKAKPPAVKEAAPQPPKFDGKIGSRKFRKANPTASFGQESISGLDLHKAADLLAGVEFTFPTQAEKLWRESDGLPAPDDGQFAQKASRFLAAHPIPPPNEKIAVWEIPDVSSRQCKCLAYLASGKKEGRGKVANLCVAQAVRLLWMLPPRTWRGRKNIVDRAFYAATGSLCMTGTLLRRQAEDGSVLYEVGTQWLRTGLGQFVTYGDRGDQTLRKAAEALIGDAIADPKIRDLHGTDDEFFSQIDLTRPDMREVARCVADGDFEQAKLAYVDVLAVRFSGKRDRPKPPTKKKAVDTHIADDICRNIFIITCHMHIRADFGKEVDWSRVFNNDIESRVWMNYHP